MSRLRFVILCLLGGFAVFLGFLLADARMFPGFKPGSLKDMLPPNVDMRLTNLVLNETGGGDRTLALRALSASYFKDRDFFALADVSADIVAVDGVFSVQAQTGRYEPEGKRVILTGNVRTANAQGRILTAPRLTLDMARGVFSSEEPFCLEDPMLNLSGDRFVYDTKKGILEVEGQVRLTLGRSR
jgi:LPS export ABC transporter protein LptC